MSSIGVVIGIGEMRNDRFETPAWPNDAAKFLYEEIDSLDVLHEMG
jgi:hypothetical protein